MKQANSHFKNAGNNQNDILDLFSGKYNCFTDGETGNGDFQTFSEEFHERDITKDGLPIGERTRLMLTHPNHDMSQMDKGFIVMEVEFEVGFDTILKKEDFLYSKTIDLGEGQNKGEKTYIFNSDPYNLNYIFVGFKNAVEIISESKYYCKGELIKEYNQNELTRESYVYNMTRPKDILKGTYHAHSLWENVSNMSPNDFLLYLMLL